MISHSFKKKCLNFFFFKLINYFWLWQVFTAVCRFSLVVGSGGYSLSWLWGPFFTLCCEGFSLRWFFLLCSTGCGAQGSSCHEAYGGPQPMGSKSWTQWLTHADMGSSWIGDWTDVPCIVRQILNYWTTREALNFLTYMQDPLLFGPHTLLAQVSYCSLPHLLIDHRRLFAEPGSGLGTLLNTGLQVDYQASSSLVKSHSFFKT